LAAVLRRRSAAVRHAVLTTAIACAALMPVLELMVPQLPVLRWINAAGVQSSGLTFSSELPAVVTAAATAASPASHAVAWPILLAVLWAAGALVTFTGLVISLWRLRKLRASCSPVSGGWRTLTDSLARECGVAGTVQLLQTDDPTLLVTYGMFRPGIILPSSAGDWTDDRQRIVLRHELAHIRRHDAAIQVAAELLRVMQPFNPLVWMACRRLRQESEYACDDAVLSAGVGATDYATHLFDVAKQLSGRQTIWAAAPAIAHPSTLERRIVAMLQHQKDRRPLTRGGWKLAAVLALGVSLPLAAVGIAPETTTLPTGPKVAVPTPATPSASATTNARPMSTTFDVPVVKTVQPAQTSLTGLVQDETGGRIPGAAVTVTNVQTQEPQAAVTNASGAFQFVHLSPANYELFVQLSGFRNVRVPIDLSAGKPTNLTVTLPIGALSEELHVACKAPSLSILQMFFPTLSAQEQPSAPIRVGGSIKAPRKTKDVRPICPAGGVAGDVMVLLEGHIGVDGFISDTKPLATNDGTDPPAEFYESVKDAVQKWEFTPTLLNNVPVEVTITVTVRFTRG
ncbi:MAG: M56 family metallopeptidase, partial [Vicinamibacterales bacterium]